VILFAIGLSLTPLATVASGSAAELDDRKTEVARKLAESAQDLDQSSARLTAADQRLTLARTALGDARAALVATRQELTAAEALDHRLQRDLAEATQDLSSTRAALDEGHARMSRRLDSLRAIVANQYAAGSSELMALSTVFTTQDPGQLTSGLISYNSIVEFEASTLARLKVTQALLEVQESTLEEAEREVALRRAAAAANLAEQHRLESQARVFSARIRSLVARQSLAREAAARAKSEDLHQLRQLEDERAQISALLRRRAEKARAEAEARARAEAEARAEARARAEAAKKARQTHETAPNADRTPGDTAASPGHGSTSRPDPHPTAAEPEPAEAGLVYPVDGYITSPYGMRFHPVYKRWSLHDGTDFGAACGTPVRASASGTVVAAYYGGAYGNRIVLDHGVRGGVGLGTTYNHLSGYATSPGDEVRQGEVIGYVGTTGASTGCHLHFMVFEDGATVDPMKWL
jgi:murein DD-endopeptidase MepM/ murein hydrolase activator NlpD